MHRKKMIYPRKPKHLAYLLITLTATAIALIGCSCESNPAFLGAGKWVSDIPFTYSIGHGNVTIPHDNRIYESANFLIFSDASSDEVKQHIAFIAEMKLRELKQAFDISISTELGIINQETKIMVYANRDMAYQKMLYFPIGMIIYSLDSPYWSNFNEATGPSISDVKTFSTIFKHELMHVFQHLLGLGLDGYDDWPEV
jgi:hypothetical protein